MKNKEIVIDTRLNTILFDNTKYYDVPKEILSYIRELEKDNKDLDRENQILFETNLNLQNNRDKAIEFMKNNSKISLDDSVSIVRFYKQLKSILESDSD